MDTETNDWVCSLFTRKPYTGKVMWLNVILIGIGCHLFGLLGAYLLVTRACFYTWIACAIVYNCSIMGILIGGHRLWSHKTFKANLPLRIVLMLMSSSAYQRDMITWATWHRIHHKWMDTDADPHNINRGFFFAHMGWLFLRPHPEYLAKKRVIDISDLQADPVLRFQRKYYHFISPFCASLIPATVAVLCWGEDPLTAVSSMFARWILALHVVWCVNSVAHTFGMRPINPKITPTDNFLMQLATYCEGYHNFHHTFPQDYTQSELGVLFNPFARLIEFLAWIGWATDLKTVSPERVDKKKIANLTTTLVSE